MRAWQKNLIFLIRLYNDLDYICIFFMLLSAYKCKYTDYLKYTTTSFKNYTNIRVSYPNRAISRVTCIVNLAKSVLFM